MKIMIGIPTLDNVHWEFFLHTTPILARLRLDHEVVLCCINRCSIDRARQMVVENAFAQKADRVLFIDDDTLIPADTFERLNNLLEGEKVLSASGVSYQRGYPYWPMVYKYQDFDWKNSTPDYHSHQVVEMPNEPFQVSCNGMGVSLLDVGLMKEVAEPCFSRNGMGTEDFYFYQKVFVAGYEAWVDPSVQATHMGEREKVNEHNATDLRGRALSAIVGESSGRALKGEATL